MWISEILSLLCYPELCSVSVMLSVWTQMAAVSSDWVRMHASNLTTAVKVISNKTLFFSYPQIQMNEVMFMPIIQIFTKLSNDLCDVIFSCWMHVPYFIEQGFTFNSTGGKNCMDELIAICLSFNMFRVLWKIQNLSSYTNQNQNILIRN